MLYLPLDKLVTPSTGGASTGDTLTVPQTRMPEVQVSPPEDPARARGVR
jgi:hypothetical protein